MSILKKLNCNIWDAYIRRPNYPWLNYAGELFWENFSPENVFKKNGEILHYSIDKNNIRKYTNGRLEITKEEEMEVKFKGATYRSIKEVKGNNCTGCVFVGTPNCGAFRKEANIDDYCTNMKCIWEKVKEEEKVERKFKVGDKVVPISKSVNEPLDAPTGEWTKAQEKKQGFLIVNRVHEDFKDEGFHTYVCSFEGRYYEDHFKEEDLIMYNEFAKGEKVLVKDYNDYKWNECIYLTTIDGSKYPFIVVDESYEDNFHDGKKFDTDRFEEIKKINDKIDMKLTVNGKEVPFSTLSAETLKSLTAMEKE